MLFLTAHRQIGFRQQNDGAFDLPQILSRISRTEFEGQTSIQGCIFMNITTSHATDQIIDALVAAYGINHEDLRARHTFTQSLHNLVRLAKAEQLLAMRTDVAKVHHPAHGKASGILTTRQ